ncbi:MAG: 2OG-Fe(II) oxygenase [Nannocystaceae bacterium]|nr:2OG-Fe(II) oxygenase [bacterium]
MTPMCNPPARVTNIDDRTLLVFDELFSSSQVRNFAHVVTQLEYTRRASFDGELNANIDEDAFRRAPFLHPVLEALVAEHRAAMNVPDTTTMSHVYAAAMSSQQQTQIHFDLESPSAITFLYYANAFWRRDWQGETVFYDATGDAAAIVSPRPGRLAMFHSNIAHRAGAPHRDAASLRYAVSVFYYPPEGGSNETHDKNINS